MHISHLSRNKTVFLKTINYQAYSYARLLIFIGKVIQLYGKIFKCSNNHTLFLILDDENVVGLGLEGNEPRWLY